MVEIKEKLSSLESLISNSSDFKELNDRLHELKLIMIQSPFLTSEEEKMSIEDRINCRSILEYDAIIGLESKNLAQFRHAMKQLKTSYFRKSNIPKSDKSELLLSLYLVDLLAQERFSDFNVELPMILEISNKDDVNICFAIELERALDDNTFSQIFELEENPPSTLFQQFTENLLESARNNNASSIELSCKRITIEQIKQILHFNNIDEAIEFAKKRNWVIINSDEGHFVSFENIQTKSKTIVDNAERYVNLAVSVSSIQ